MTDIKFSNTESEYTIETKYTFQTSSEVIYNNVDTEVHQIKRVPGLCPYRSQNKYESNPKEKLCGVGHRIVISQACVSRRSYRSKLEKSSLSRTFIPWCSIYGFLSACWSIPYKEFIAQRLDLLKRRNNVRQVRKKKSFHFILS